MGVYISNSRRGRRRPTRAPESYPPELLPPARDPIESIVWVFIGLSMAFGTVMLVVLPWLL